MNNFARFLSTFALGVGLLALSACSYVPFAYTVPVDQGNMLTQEDVDKLQVGMSEEQVRFLLGTPLLKDIYRADRWDYVYTFKDNHKLQEDYRLVVSFKDGSVTDFQGTGTPPKA